MSESSSLFTYDALLQLGALAFLDFLIVAYTKHLVDRWEWWGRYIGTDLYAVFWGMALVLVPQIALGADPLDWTLYPLAVANGFLVAMTAGKAHDKAANPRRVDR